MLRGMQMSRAGMIAVGAALVAVATSLIAVIVVVRRPDPVAATPETPRPKKREQVKRTKVTARDVLDLSKSVVPTRQRSTNGVEVDGRLRDALGLEDGDVIVELSGRKVSSDRDVRDVMLGLGMMEARTIYVDLVRDGDPLLVRWEVDGELRPKFGSRDPLPYTPPPYMPPDPITPDPVTPDPLVDSIKKIDDTTYEIPRSTIDALAADPMKIAKGARVVPAMKSGKPEGFKLYAIRPSSIWNKLGLSNGDTIRAINGLELTTVDKMLEVYKALGGAKEYRVDVTRRGKPVLLTYKITK
jgi:hypothetical protein